MKNDQAAKLLKIFCVLIIALCVGSLAHNAKIKDWPYSDSKGSLLSGQALLEHGSFDLTPYKESLPLFQWQLYRNDHEIFYAYPLGTTLLHLPVIWLCNQSGHDLSISPVEGALNRDLAAFSLVLVFILTFVLFSRRCSFKMSIIFSVIIALGTNAFSTIGLALWNLNYAVIFTLSVILILDKTAWMERKATGWILGLLLFLGFAVRPSLALLVVVTFGYLVVFYRRHFYRAASISGILLGLYLVFSLSTFGSLLPGQYQLRDFHFGPRMVTNLISQLISPSRGFFIFCPIFLFTVAGLIKMRKQAIQSPLVVAVTIWLFSIAIFLSSWFLWWGGGGFGNRLWTETLPAWIYLSAVTWPALFEPNSKTKRALLYGAFVLVSLGSVWIHVYQGANNQWTVTWHHQPDKDLNPEYFWNFQFPQFLASEAQINEMKKWHADRELEKHGVLYKSYDLNTEGFEFRNWYPPEGKDLVCRWSSGHRASITIPYKSLGLPRENVPQSVKVAIEGRTYLNQNIVVIINNKRIGKIKTLNKDPRNQFYTDWFELVPGRAIDITFEIRNPKSPAVETPHMSNDARDLGLRLYAINLYEKCSPNESNDSFSPQ